MTTQHMSFKHGDSVWIINSTLSGKAIVEGKATIVCPTEIAGYYYMVRFAGDRTRYERYVDPSAQADPHAFVAQLNKVRAIARATEVQS